MLALHEARPQGDATPEDLLRAVSQLTLLTELRWHARWHRFGTAEPEMQPPSHAAFTALTASSNLCSLELSWQSSDVPQSPVFLQPGRVSPCLRHIDLSGAQAADSECTPISVDFLYAQLLCSSCTTLDSLAFALGDNPAPTALLPLLQLSPLTRLSIHEVGAAAATAVGAVAQLTKLRDLTLRGLPRLDSPMLLQLTALTALQRLWLEESHSTWNIRLFNKARSGTPPDVCKQLLRSLLRDASFRQALLQDVSTDAAAAPSRLVLAQLAVTLAEELAAVSPSWQ